MKLIKSLIYGLCPIILIFILLGISYIISIILENIGVNDRYIIPVFIIFLSWIIASYIFYKL